MKKKLIVILMAMAITISMSIPAFATEKMPTTTVEKLHSTSYRENIKEQYNIYELSNRFSVDPEALTDAVIKGEDSPKFSPFSELEIIGDTKIKENRVPELSLPRNQMPAPRLFEVWEYNQDSTAYLATGDPGASGLMPWVGSCAVHKVSSTDRNPVIPFGTSISYLTGSVSIGGKNYGAFVVNDTGDANYIRSAYWTDLYFGDNTAENRTSALNYGIKKVDIYFIR